jgi:hypothetical protein
MQVESGTKIFPNGWVSEVLFLVHLVDFKGLFGDRERN